MNYRLISLLSLLQDAIQREGGVSVTGTRMVNFHKQIARLSIKDGGAIHVQGYHLADGQSCVKIALWWPNVSKPAIHSLFPSREDFNWTSAVGRIALCWLAGPEMTGLHSHPGHEADAVLSKLEAVG